MDVNPKIGVFNPQNGWFISWKTLLKGMIWEVFPLFLETSIYNIHLPYIQLWVILLLRGSQCIDPPRLSHDSRPNPNFFPTKTFTFPKTASEQKSSEVIVTPRKTKMFHMQITPK